MLQEESRLAASSDVDDDGDVVDEGESDVEGASSSWPPPPVPSPPFFFFPAAADDDATGEAEKLLPWQLLLLQQHRAREKAEVEVDVEVVEAAAAAAAARAAVDDDDEDGAVEWLRSPPLDASEACSNAEDADAAILEATTAERRALLERAAAVAASILTLEAIGNSAIRERENFAFFPLCRED